MPIWMEIIEYEDGYRKEIVRWETPSGKKGETTTTDPMPRKVWEGDHLQPSYHYRFEEGHGATNSQCHVLSS